MAEQASDQSTLATIQGLVHEEQRLWGHNQQSEQDRSRLAQIKIELDQCWDLLRQREARREFGQDPDGAKVRPASVVEGYEQ